MSFVWPQYLWLLLIVPALVAAYVAVLRKKKDAVRYANVGLVKAAIGPAQRFRRHVPPLLFLLALIGVLIAVARPSAIVTLPSDARTIIMAMDVSLSMRATDVDPNRIVAAQNAAKEFVQGAAARHQVPASSRSPAPRCSCSRRRRTARTSSRRSTASSCSVTPRSAAASSCRSRLSSPRTASISSSACSATGSARATRAQREKTSDKDGERKLKAEKKEVKPVPAGSYKSAAIILLTDGRRTTGPDPLDAARMAADRGVRVFTVGFGSTGGGSVDIDGMSIYMRFDEETLKGIAGITQAEYFHAASSQDLKKIYEGSNTKFALERKETEISALFAAAAALLAVASAVLSLLWFNRLV